MPRWHGHRYGFGRVHPHSNRLLQEIRMNSSSFRIRTLALAGLACTLGAVPALAASPTPSFKTLDSNGDGVVSLEEFTALGGSVPAFRAADTNGDNRLDPEEFAKIGGEKAPQAKQ
jgi:hypothetical protein